MPRQAVQRFRIQIYTDVARAGRDGAGCDLMRSTTRSWSAQAGERGRLMFSKRSLKGKNGKPEAPVERQVATGRSPRRRPSHDAMSGETRNALAHRTLVLARVERTFGMSSAIRDNTAVQRFEMHRNGVTVFGVYQRRLSDLVIRHVEAPLRARYRGGRRVDARRCRSHGRKAGRSPRPADTRGHGFVDTRNIVIC